VTSREVLQSITKLVSGIITLPFEIRVIERKRKLLVLKQLAYVLSIGLCEVRSIYSGDLCFLFTYLSAWIYQQTHGRAILRYMQVCLYFSSTQLMCDPYHTRVVYLIE
jgi:hypothetical protein